MWCSWSKNEQQLFIRDRVRAEGESIDWGRIKIGIIGIIGVGTIDPTSIFGVVVGMNSEAVNIDCELKAR